MFGRDSLGRGGWEEGPKSFSKLEARRVVTFRPSQTLKEFLNDADAWPTGQ